VRGMQPPARCEPGRPDHLSPEAQIADPISTKPGPVFAAATTASTTSTQARVQRRLRLTAGAAAAQTGAGKRICCTGRPKARCTAVPPHPRAGDGAASPVCGWCPGVESRSDGATAAECRDEAQARCSGRSRRRDLARRGEPGARRVCGFGHHSRVAGWAGTPAAVASNSPVAPSNPAAATAWTQPDGNLQSTGMAVCADRRPGLA
jgi:hypothetical protein